MPIDSKGPDSTLPNSNWIPDRGEQPSIPDVDRGHIAYMRDNAIDRERVKTATEGVWNDVVQATTC